MKSCIHQKIERKNALQDYQKNLKKVFEDREKDGKFLTSYGSLSGSLFPWLLQTHRFQVLGIDSISRRPVLGNNHCPHKTFEQAMNLNPYGQYLIFSKNGLFGFRNIFVSDPVFLKRANGVSIWLTFDEIIKLVKLEV